MKKMRLLVLLLVLPLLLAGCMKPLRVNQRAIVQGLGIDYENDAYSLTLQVYSAANPKEGVMLTAQGSTIAQALEDAELKQGKQVFCGQNKMIAIGEGMAKQGLEEVVSFFSSDHQTRPNLDIVTVKGRAEDLLRAQIASARLPAPEIKAMLENSGTNGKLLRGQVRALVSSMENGRVGGYTPMLEVLPLPEGGASIAVVGTAVYRHGKYRGTLGAAATRGVVWLRDEMEGASLILSSLELGKASLRVVQAHTKIKTALVGEIPHFIIRCSVESHLEESIPLKNGAKQIEKIEELERQQAELIQKEMEAALQTCLCDYNSDVFGFANRLEKYQPKWFAAHEARYEEYLPRFTYEITVHSSISRYGL